MISFLSLSLFTPQECDSILKLNTGFKKLNDSDITVAIPSKRKSSFGKVTDLDLLSQIILPKITQFGIKSLVNSQPMFIQYNKGDYFEPHTDTPYSTDPSTHRIYTLIIQLSDTNEYSGGDLKVEGEVGLRSRGAVTIFRSNKVHELTKVFSGQRNILVCMFPSSDLVLTKTSVI